MCDLATPQDGSGTISFETFQAVMATKMHTRDPREEAIKAFRLFDDDETGSCRPLLDARFVCLPPK